MKEKKAIIIGAGIGGIALSIRLAFKGYLVTIYEKNNYPGGKLSQKIIDGYRFDLGPSLFTMPFYVDELYKLAGKTPEDYFKYQKLESVCHYFYEDGTRLNITDDNHKNDELFTEILGEDKGSFLAFLKQSKTIYTITHSVFLLKSLHKFKTYLSLETIRSFLNIGKIGIFKSMNKENVSRFKNPKSTQFFNRYATYNGSNPYKAPSTLNIIPHFEFGFGAYFPEGGMISITNSLVELAKSLGVSFTYNSHVKKILTKARRVNGVILDSHEIVSADLVISNQDVRNTFKYLLNDSKKSKRVFKNEPSSSALIFYWGINKTFDDLSLHNILFSSDYAGEFNAIFNNKTLHPDPTIYINITSKYNASDAPEGCENWFVMINAPYNASQDWPQLIAKAKKDIVAKINRILKTNIEKHIVVESILDPLGIENATGSFAGSLYGSSSNNKMAAFFRHANFSNKYNGLYFCGGSVHPGGGIPLCLLSAKITSELIR